MTVRRIARYAWFALWAAVVSIPLAYASGLHNLPLPILGQPTKVQMPSGRWRLTHILAAGCPCSRIIAEHLKQRGLLHGSDERVWIVGRDDACQSTMMAAGFPTEIVDAEKLQRESGVSGGPWLMIADPAGHVVYSGGYAAQRVAVPSQAQDVELLTHLQQGQRLTPFASFGCATSRQAQQLSDPLGLKY
jgi:hypothetical protein